MKPVTVSSGVLRENVTRMLNALPSDARQTIKSAIPASTLRTAIKSIKSATLRTVDELAAALDTEPWMLLHPDMMQWEENRDWIRHLVGAYLAADPTQREAFQAIARMVRPAKDSWQSAIPIEQTDPYRGLVVEWFRAQHKQASESRIEEYAREFKAWCEKSGQKPNAETMRRFSSSA